MFSRQLEKLSLAASSWTGTSLAFVLAASSILVWAALGPACHFSTNWQLVINTGTTIVTFLMVFLIQRSQNKEALAVQLKLNEIVAAIKGASNRMIDIEDLDECELAKLQLHYRSIAEHARQKPDHCAAPKLPAAAPAAGGSDRAAE